MREYRKRKRVAKMGVPAPLSSTPSVVRAPERLRVSRKRVYSPGPQPAPTKSAPVRKGVRSSFKTSLELARTFPFGALASRVCPYCYNTGYSSPGTRCSYCRQKSHL